jgi:hypothetical protein
MIRGGIFGPSLSGKTTLGINLSRDYWTKKGIRSLVYDPQDNVWGPQAWQTTDEKHFLQVVRTTRNALVIIDDASVTIKRDRDLLDLFTTLRHNEHRLLVIGHTASDLIPPMRKQLETLFLFWQDRDEAIIWEKLFPRSNLSRAFDLEQYHFLMARRFGMTSDPVKLAI